MNENPTRTLKDEFQLAYAKSIGMFGEIKKMVVAVRLPTEATELIINTENLDSKYEYYLNAYDDDMKLKTNPTISIVGCLFV
jgi:hypothetical protein